MPIDLKAPSVASEVHLWSCDEYLAPRLPSYHQPCRADLFDQLFVSHFIESFGFKESTADDPSSTWLDKLALFITSPSPPLVKNSIRAGSMFFYGSLVDDVSIRTEANKWYLKALQGLRSLLFQQTGVFTGDIICSAVMLAHFETSAGTSGEAWFQHVQGAARMLESGGPASCRDGFLHQLFRHLRLLTVSENEAWFDYTSDQITDTLVGVQFIAAFFQSQQHVFSSHDWLEVPFEAHSKTAFDEFVDILLSLLPCLTGAREMINSADEETNQLKTELTKLIEDLMSQLHAWWTKCSCSTNFIETNAEKWMRLPKDGFQDLHKDPDHFPLIPYLDMPTASLAALFHAVNVIILRLSSLVSSNAHLYENRIQRHVNSILFAKEFVATFPSPASSRGSVMVGLPIKIISIWNPPEMALSAKNRFPGLDGQDEDGASHSIPSRELFGDVASYVLQRYNPGVLK